MYSNTIEQIKRNSDCEIFFLTIRAVPDGSSDDEANEEEGIQGAYVNCYINADSLCEAEQTAIDLMKENGWKPVTFLYWQVFSKESYPDPNSPDFEELSTYMEEALSFGNSMVFYQWSDEDTNEDVDEGWKINFSYQENS